MWVPASQLASAGFRLTTPVYIQRTPNASDPPSRYDFFDDSEEVAGHQGVFEPISARPDRSVHWANLISMVFSILAVLVHLVVYVLYQTPIAKM